MKKSIRYSAIAGSIACAVVGLNPATVSAANPMTPLQSALLSVDINGGTIASNNATTEGSNGPSGTPTLSADPFGVTWTPWGGPVSTSGDGIQLPSSQSTPNVFASTISKSFVTGSGTFNATLSLDVANNASRYAQGGGTATFNSRDRGTPSGAAADGDLYRDFVFAGTGTGTVQGMNYVKLTVSGFVAGQTYQLALYSFDTTGAHSVNWTAIAPTLSGGSDGWWQTGNPGNNTFTAPSDQQTITWSSGGASPAPAVLTEVADGSGNLTVYGYGGTGSGQNADTTYLDGFQIAAVPEPSTLALLGLGATGAFFMRRKKA